MEEIELLEQRAIKIKASELLKKFPHREDRYNFCRQRIIEFYNIYS